VGFSEQPLHTPKQVVSALLAECPQGLTELGAPTEFSLLLLREFHGASFYVNN
jgi:hypothetical protein